MSADNPPTSPNWWIAYASILLAAIVLLGIKACAPKVDEPVRQAGRVAP